MPTWFWILSGIILIAFVIFYIIVDRELRQYDDSDGPTLF